MSAVKRWLARLVEPAADIREPEQRRRAQLLSAVALFMILFAAAALLFNVLPITQGTPEFIASLFVIEGAAALAFIAAYALSRTRHFQYGAGLLAAAMTAAAFASVLLEPVEALRAAFLLQGVVISSVFLPWRFTALTLAATLAAVLALPALHPDLSAGDLLTPGFLILYIGGLVLLAAALRERDQRQMERQTRALLETSQRLGSIMQSADDAIISFNERGYVVGWNRAAEVLFGLTEADALGRPAAQIFAPEARSEFAQAVERVRLSGQTQSLGQAGDFNGLRLSGETFPVEVSLTTWPAEGELYFTGFVRDVAERRQAQAALHEAHERLQATVGELRRRTLETSLLVEMGELLQACTTLEEAYRVIGNSASQIFAGTAGALSLISASRVVVETVLAWGDRPPAAAGQTFAPDQCWALRRGRIHVVNATPEGLVCRHVGSPPPARYLCAPMVAQGESLGILHIVGVEAAASAADFAWYEGLAARTAEHIGPALANIRLRDTLRSQSIRDPLTELFNRRFLEETLTREIRRSERSGQPLSVIMLDLDHFKDFNDRFGHAAGDALLRQLGQYLAESFRGGDVPCRYGGEEFIVLLPEAGLEAAAERARELVKGIRGLSVRHRGQPLTGVTASAGVAAWRAGWTGDLLVRAADSALYKAKALGRDRVEQAEGEEAQPV